MEEISRIVKSNSPPSETRTVMFIDIVGYTTTTTKLSREEFNKLHDEFDSTSLPIFKKYGGSVIKKIGDAFLITFPSPTDALHCGMSLQNTFGKRNQQHQLPITIRVAIHAGEVMLRDNDIYGNAVNTAARIESMVAPGDICFSEAVFLAMNKNEIPWQEIGYRQFKGLEYPIKIFRVKKPLKKRIISPQIIETVLFVAVALGLLFALRYVWTNTDIVQQITAAATGLRG
jgi:adenylate cyclase